MGSARVKGCGKHVFCDCFCHSCKPGVVKHCRACCRKCERCGRFVKWDRK